MCIWNSVNVDGSSQGDRNQSQVVKESRMWLRGCMWAWLHLLVGTHMLTHTRNLLWADMKKLEVIIFFKKTKQKKNRRQQRRLLFGRLSKKKKIKKKIEEAGTFQRWTERDEGDLMSSGEQRNTVPVIPSSLCDDVCGLDQLIPLYLSLSLFVSLSLFPLDTFKYKKEKSRSKVTVSQVSNQCVKGLGAGR